MAEGVEVFTVAFFNLMSDPNFFLHGKRGTAREYSLSPNLTAEI